MIEALFVFELFSLNLWDFFLISSNFFSFAEIELSVIDSHEVVVLYTHSKDA